MPIYEYSCTRCGREFEEIIFKSGEAVACPSCDSRETRKLMSRCRSKMTGREPAGGLGMSAGGGGCSSCGGGSCATCG
jgi:putative FmdB family regulatory protein